VQLGIFARLWQIVLELYDDLVGLDWRWQSVDGVLHYIRLLRTTLRDALTRSRGIHCGVKEHLCMDKGYDSVAAKNMVENVFDYIPDLRSRGEEKKVNATANNVLDVG
jgi:putative transposase